jgi:hypothetical protein
MQNDELFKALLGDVVRNKLLARQTRGRRAVPQRILVEVRVVEAHSTQQVERGLVLFLGFARERNDHIGGKCNVRNRAAHQIDFLQIAFDGVAAQHALERAIMSRLHGQVQLVADGWLSGHHLDQIGREIVGVRRCEADAPNAVHARDRAQQT